MIAVIADDLTGAAEIGGIALRQGWNAIISTSVTEVKERDVLIIATNTRSQRPEEARKTIHELTVQLLKLNPEFIYKKLDSVLRGNVSAELQEQMAVSGKERGLIIPSNPSLKRLIKNGIYYYEGVPLNESSFSNGPAFKRRSSNVIDLIGKESADFTSVISAGDRLPAKGLIIGNTVEEADLDRWAEKLDEHTVMAGGSSFFNALLRKKRLQDQNTGQPVFELGRNKIYVCGSAFQLSRSVVADSYNAGQLVAHMPSNIFNEGIDRKSLIAQWEEKIIQGIRDKGTVIIAIDFIESPQPVNLGAEICKVVATVVERVMQRIKVEELVIEGGATASSIIEKLKYNKFYPVQELSLGVIRMKVEENSDLFLTMKPGSYNWPASIWRY